MSNRHLGAKLFLLALVCYFLVPVWWLVVASTKNAEGLFSGTGALWFNGFHLFGNLRDLFTYNNGEYLRWLGNSVLYALTGGIGSTIISVLAGYGFAKYQFRGRNLTFALVLGSVMVPLTALVIPTFVMMSNAGLTDTVWAVILPSLLSPFGVYLMRVYTSASVPDRLVVLGGGVVACEMAQAYAGLGSTVTLVERGNRLLARTEDFVGDLVADGMRETGSIHEVRAVPCGGRRRVAQRARALRS